MFQLIKDSLGNFSLVGEAPTLKSDTALDNSDKTFTVPADKVWKINSLLATLATTATVGNRQLEVWVRDATDNVLFKIKAGVVQAASLTYDYVFADGLPRETAVVANTLMTPLPKNLVLPAGYKLRVFDSAAIAAAADDLTLRLLIEEADSKF